jgi:hypothetical protein
MITRLFTRSALHEHADPAQRALGVAQLDPESDELKSFLLEDPAAEVRAAAARRCADATVLAQALRSEADGEARSALADALAAAIASSADDAAVQTLLEDETIDDAIRAEVARRAGDTPRRRLAIEAIRNENALLDLALGASQAEARLAAAERIRAPENLHKVAESAKHKDHGVYRIVRQRLDALKQRAEHEAEADRVLAQLEALASRPGAILTEVIELNRRWQALDLRDDAARMARGEAVRRSVQERLEREQEEQRARARAEGQLRDWLAQVRAIADLPDSTVLAAFREQHDALRAEAAAREDRDGLEQLDAAQERLARWEHEAQAVAAAEALVVEAEQLAQGTYIDHGDLPERWQALDLAMRTPALTRRFEAAMIAVDQRRLAHVQAAQQEASALRSRIHAALHSAEQSLAGGQLREARTNADQIKKLRTGAGTLPKPTMQRIGRLQQQLVELERWESFGQHNARVQLCERAEAAAQHTGDLRELAQTVQALRNEWKALDQQYAGVPKSLWERFDRACEKAYAPAARHFAELAARRKEARKKRDEFIALAAEHAQSMLQEPRDWRAIERWLREIEQKWRDGELGSLEPRAWKELDARLKTALAPLRQVLGEAREGAKAVRRDLIEQARALSEKALERETPARVKALQAQWQEHAKSISLAQRDERILWDEFRGACDAVFKTREDRRKQEDGRKHEARHALEAICAELDRLAAAKDKSEQDVRRELRGLQEQWRTKAGGADPALRGLESRFRSARSAVEASLSARVRSRENAVWQTLASKERLCEELDALVRSGGESAEAQTRVTEVEQRWSELPGLSHAVEQRMIARRDAARNALLDSDGRDAYRRRIEQSSQPRQEALLELEVLLGLDSPPELQSERLALQVRQLRDRFKNAASVGPEAAAGKLGEWAAQPGVLESRDRARAERIFTAVGRRR